MENLRTLSAWVMGLAYVAAGINHFLNPDFYLKIMPSYLPSHGLLVQLSGVAEIVLGLMILLPRYRKPAAWGIIAMLVVFMTVHIHMVQNPRLFKNVPEYLLWLRIPLQFVLILWAYWYTLPYRPVNTSPLQHQSRDTPDDHHNTNPPHHHDHSR